MELANEQAQAAVLVEVADERRRVPGALDVESLLAGLDLHRRQQFLRAADYSGTSEQKGREGPPLTVHAILLLADPN